MAALKVAAATRDGKPSCFSWVGVAANCIRVPATLLAAAPRSPTELW